MSCLLATPVRGRSAEIDYVVGLMGSQPLIKGWLPCPNQSDVYVARNTLVHEFMNTDIDTLVFVDSDIGFSPKNLSDLLETKEAFVSGLYPDKDFPTWVFRGEDGAPVPLDKIPPSGLLKARYLGCGFLKIDRCVFEAVAEAGLAEPFGVKPPDYKGKWREAHQYFRGLVVERYLLSEDYSFSHLVAKAGFQPYVNCGIRLSHGGRRLPDPPGDAA
jgi:hypothetical protein